jgi:methylated-DNA-[protein]-cysteine S-methyltransferase
MTHTIEEQLQSWTPQLRPPTFPTADVSYVVTDTAVGRVLLASTEAGAVVSSRYVADQDAEDAFLDRMARQVSPRILHRPAALDEPRRQLDAFLAGRRHDFELDLDLELATPFQRSVLTTLARTVGYGERATYGALAASMAKPSASRAVGAALGANPLCILLPCHRVVGARGELTGYAGGVPAKRYLLDLEAAA